MLNKRNIIFNLSDFDLFDQDMSPGDFDFFKKHTGAFRNMLEDQSTERKQEFVNTFRTFSLVHGCMKGCPSKNDNRHGYLDEATKHFNKNFVNGKFSTARNIVMDAVILAQNRHTLQHMSASSYSKDPFFHKETRDVFRRLFGQPSEKGTCYKVLCVMPLHIKFGGSICRYLRRWLDVEPHGDYSGIANRSLRQLLKSTSKGKKRDKAYNKVTSGITKGMTDTEADDFHYTFQKLLDYNPLNYDPRDFPTFTEDEPVKKKELEHKTELLETNSLMEIPNSEGEGLSLSEYLGLKTKKENSIANVVDCPAGSASGSSKIPQVTEQDETSYLYEKCHEFLQASVDDTVPQIEDGSYEEIKQMLILDKPHPNVQFEQLSEKTLSSEDQVKLRKCKEFIRDQAGDGKQKVAKRHACANCRRVEPEPKKFKKCQRCHGRRTRFYCSKKCQEEDWVSKHRDDHNFIDS